MRNGALYTLAESACVEPLVGRWIAWPHVLAPAVYSFHLTNYQLKTLHSFLSNPELHEKSCRNPRLIGGAFVDIAPGKASQVQQLLATMQEKLAENVAFATTLTEYYGEVVRSAKGESLEERYDQVPGPLHGYIELLYDYFNQPIVRCLEGPLYKSRYYKRELQSLRLFCLERDEARPYYMSTPRLSDEASIDWNIPFDDARIDDFFRLDCQPRPREEISELLGLDLHGDSVSKFLRKANERADPRWRGPGVRVRYFGHACVLFETRDVAVLIDPLVAVRPEESGLDRFSYDDLPDHLDFVLITHGHHDHFVVELCCACATGLGRLSCRRIRTSSMPICRSACWPSGLASKTCAKWTAWTKSPSRADGSWRRRFWASTTTCLAPNLRISSKPRVARSYLRRT